MGNITKFRETDPRVAVEPLEAYGVRCHGTCQSKLGMHVVLRVEGKFYCNCPFFTYNATECRHILDVKSYLELEPKVG